MLKNFFLKWSAEKLTLVAICVTVFTLPLVFLPALVNAFDLPKQFILLLGVSVAFLAWLAALGLHKKVVITRSNFDLPILFFVGAGFLSAFLTSNRSLSLLSDPLTYASAGLLFFLIGQTVSSRKTLDGLISLILLSGVVLVVWSGLGIAFPALATVVNNPILKLPFFTLTFSPAGTYLTQAMFLLVLVPLAAGNFFNHRTRDAAVMLVIILAGLAISGFTIYKNPLTLLPADTGWKVATGMMGRSVLSAVVGIGPGYFVDAFTAFKPAEFNASPFWNLRFTSGSNFYLYLLTTIGLAGLFSFLFLIWRFAQVVAKRAQIAVLDPMEKGLLGSIIVALGLYAFLPGPALVTVGIFVMLGLLVAFYNLGDNGAFARKKELILSGHPWFSFLPLVVFLVLVGSAVYLSGRAVLADYFFSESLSAASSNRGTDVYNRQAQAIKLAPNNDTYHVAFSQTNLALADSLAGNADLTDQQKQAVVQLVQQAISEGRVAVMLNPQRSANWENLAVIYRSLINFATGADQWTLTSLNQAITLDPTNPSLRLDLGGLYLVSKDYTSAAQLFSTAVSLKGDLANAHYNLAQAMKLLNMRDRALQELQTTASLVCGGTIKSTECDKVNQEITDLSGTTSGANPASTPPVQEGTISGTQATPAAGLATPSAQTKNLPKAKTTPPVEIASPSGEITP